MDEKKLLVNIGIGALTVGLCYLATQYIDGCEPPSIKRDIVNTGQTINQSEKYHSNYRK